MSCDLSLYRICDRSWIVSTPTVNFGDLSRLTTQTGGISVMMMFLRMCRFAPEQGQIYPDLEARGRCAFVSSLTYLLSADFFKDIICDGLKRQNWALVVSVSIAAPRSSVRFLPDFLCCRALKGLQDSILEDRGT
jgi:hypothetical protein